MKRKINNTDLDNHINARDKNGQTALIHGMIILIILFFLYFDIFYES